MTLNDLVNATLKLSTPDKLPELNEILKQGASSIRTNSVSDIVKAVNKLDAKQHTLGVLYLMNGLASAAPAKDMDSTALICQFLMSCPTRQIMYAPDKLSEIATTLKIRGDKMEKLIAVLPAVCRALGLATTRDAYLSPLHISVVEACMDMRAYKALLPLITKPVFQVSQKLRTLDVLRYHFLAGVAFCTLKKFKEAQASFRICVSLPAEALSEIAVAAYSRLILVNLIVDGTSNGLPKYAPHVVDRYIDDCVRPYLSIAGAFDRELAGISTKKSQKSLNDVFAANLKVLEDDKNLGLAKQVVAALSYKRVMRLMETYVTISLEDLRKSIKVSSIAEAEQCVRDLVESGDIFARIDQKEGMVEFLDDPESFKSQRMEHQLESQVTQAVKLSRRLAAVEKSITLSSDYVRKTMELEKGQNPSAAGSSSFEAEGRDGAEGEFIDYR